MIGVLDRNWKADSRPNSKSDFTDLREINIDRFDLLVDVMESNYYNLNWRTRAENWKIPRIYYITNPACGILPFTRYTVGELGVDFRNLFNKTEAFYPNPFKYMKKVGKYPVVFTNETLQREWKVEGDVIYFTAPKLWEDSEYIGDEEKILCVASCFYSSRPPKGKNLALFFELKKAFPNTFVIHDPIEKNIPEKEFIEFVRHKRVMFEHDMQSSGRALSQMFVKSLALGIPTIVWNTDITCAKYYAGNVNSIPMLKDYLNMIISEKAKHIGIIDAENRASKGIYQKYFSQKIIKPQWEQKIEEAMQC
jgi:hypothetical protein